MVMYGAFAFWTGKLNFVLSMCVYSNVWGHCFLGRENHILVVSVFMYDNV